MALGRRTAQASALLPSYSAFSSWLAALALVVAESAPKDKEVMIRLVMNMLAETTASASFPNPS